MYSQVFAYQTFHSFLDRKCTLVLSVCGEHHSTTAEQVVLHLGQRCSNSAPWCKNSLQ